MLRFIKKYYLATFAGFFVGALIKELLTKSDNSFAKNLLIALVTAFAVSLIAGTLFYFKDTRWGPKTRGKLFNKKPFTDLFMAGFKQHDDVLVGVVNRYTVIVNYTWPNGVSAIAINVLFDSAASNLTKDRITEIRIRHKFKLKGLLNQEYMMKDGVIGWMLTYNFTLPKYEEIISVAEGMIEVLKLEGLKPVECNKNEKPNLVAGEVTSFGFAG
ncbi:hypothetical protein ACFQZI_08700 [Mucilaginibacter lutimaris]|uniref:Uncharacterized protein n=1 Tax=Mucilaginibacter lutimaris TaxID=931629 RepID=A0ABW2ZFG2_9SPHI